ncbi:AlpA family phage regulatory protein [Porticoccaceae bacterium]|nr:AlpA family phage regulatory protein [Porticoccaceae bacterium]
MDSNHFSSSQVRLLRWRQVSQLIPFSKSHAYALVSQGKFPAPVKIIEGGKGCGWWEHEVCEWLDKRYQETRGIGHE